MRSVLLGALPPDEADRLLAMSRRRRFARQEVVFHQGDPADALHLVQRGRFAVRAITPLGDSVVMAVVGAGDCFGELALLGSTRVRTATVAALEESETRSVHERDVARLQAEHPEVLVAVVQVLAAQVERLTGRLVEALYVPSERRVLRRVAELAQLYEAPDGGETVVPLTQEELAELAGTSRATVNKVLRDAERRGLLELRRGRTVVSDLDGIEARGR